MIRELSDFPYYEWNDSPPDEQDERDPYDVSHE